MTKDDEAYFDELFGGPESPSPYPESPLINGNKSNAGNNLQLSMPLPMPVPLPSPALTQGLGAPIPAASSKTDKRNRRDSHPDNHQDNQQDNNHQSNYQDFQLPQAALNTDFTSTAESQWHDMFKDTSSNMVQGQGKQNDLQALFQQFLAQQGIGAVPAYTTSQVDHSAQLQPKANTTSQVDHAAQLQPKANPPPVGAKISHSRDKNGDCRIGQYDWYDKPPARRGWMAYDGGRQVSIKYTRKGELKQPVALDRGDIEAYIRGCAGRGIPLRLWVQNIPTIHADRYHHADHHKCRVKGCAARGTLGRGAYQVGFDEYPTETSNGRFDPFHVAVYVHLYCLEELIPMAHLMEFADVQPDVRELPLEDRNPMSLRRDGSYVLEKIFYAWKNTHHDSYVKSGVPISTTPSQSDSDCLYYNLTKKKLESQPSTRQKMRDKRNGNDISKHYGNLRKEEANRTASKRKRKMARFCSDSSSVADGGDKTATVNAVDKYSDTMPPPYAPISKRQRLSGSARPTLQTAAAYAMQSQTSAALPSPLRRSRRLSGAHAIDQIMIPPSSAFTNYTTGYTSGPSTSRGGRRSLNVQTDNTSLALDQISYTPNLDGLVYNTPAKGDPYMDQLFNELFGITNGNTSTVAGGNAAGSAGHANASAIAPDAHYLHFGQVSTPCRTYEVTSAPVPYGLRATPARLETAIKKTSARISLAEGIHCDEKRLMEAAKSPGLPMKTPAVLPRSSQTVQPTSQPTQGTSTGAISSPGRRVTRSMSRHVSAVEQPLGLDNFDTLFQQDYEFLNLEFFES